MESPGFPFKGSVKGDIGPCIRDIASYIDSILGFGISYGPPSTGP